MAAEAKLWCILFLCLASVVFASRLIVQEGGSVCKSLSANGLKSMTFRSPPVTTKPGEVKNKYFPAQFPKGHIGLKGIIAELVYENGLQVPLSDVYLHHWVMAEYGVPKSHFLRYLYHLWKGLTDTSFDDSTPDEPRPEGFPRNFANYFGKGGETRRSDTILPGPYVYESGKEFTLCETRWLLNVHCLDTRGAVSPMGCTECRCNLFNATTDEDGEPLREGYLGGLKCCGEGRQCAVKEGFNGEERSYYLQYTMVYVDWDDCVIPVTKIGIDITNPDGFGDDLVEFTVEGCGDADPDSDECVDTRVATLIAPKGGDVVLAQSHLHASVLSATIWGEDGRLICETSPIYGQGHEAGNEKGYVVGIRSCIRHSERKNSSAIKQGEKLKYVVKSTKVGGPHTGLMALAGIRLASNGLSAAY